VNDIISRQQVGRLQCNHNKELHLEMMVVFHLRVLSRGFARWNFHEDYLENVDETHFITNRGNSKRLGFRGQGEVKYADVVWGGGKLSMIERLIGGGQARIMAPMVIFTCTRCEYPI
jgi:hypothetical protein